MAFLVATTSLPAVDRPNADSWNAARSCQNITFSYTSSFILLCLGSRLQYSMGRVLVATSGSLVTQFSSRDQVRNTSPVSGRGFDMARYFLVEFYD